MEIFQQWPSRLSSGLFHEFFFALSLDNSVVLILRLKTRGIGAGIPTVIHRLLHAVSSTYAHFDFLQFSLPLATEA